jgi:hypothetical protein
MSLAGLDIAFLGATPFTDPNYTAERGRFVVKQGGRESTRSALPRFSTTNRAGLCQSMVPRSATINSRF